MTLTIFFNFRISEEEKRQTLEKEYAHNITLVEKELSNIISTNNFIFIFAFMIIAEFLLSIFKYGKLEGLRDI